MQGAIKALEAPSSYRRLQAYRVANDSLVFPIDCREDQRTKGILGSAREKLATATQKCTEQGLDLWSVLMAMWGWEARWDPDPRDQRLQYRLAVRVLGVQRERLLGSVYPDKVR